MSSKPQGMPVAIEIQANCAPFYFYGNSPLFLTTAPALSEVFAVGVMR